MHSERGKFLRLELVTLPTVQFKDSSLAYYLVICSISIALVLIYTIIGYISNALVLIYLTVK